MMQHQVMDCYSAARQNDKSAAIKTGKDDKASLSADIRKFTKHRDDLDKKIAGLEDDIEKAEKAPSLRCGKCVCLVCAH